MAKFLIEDLHPLAKTRLDIAFPFICWPLGCVRKSCFKKDEEEAEPEDIQKRLLEKIGDQALTKEQKKLKNLQKKQEEKRKERKKDLEDRDPFSWLGFGLMAYRHTMWTLFVLFTILSVLIVPNVMSNKAGEGIDATESKYGIFSLGNQGYSSV